MPSAVRLRDDYSAEELRALARRSKEVNQSRRLLSLAAVREGMDRGSAARIGGMDRQTLRDWVHRFNAAGPEGLIDNWTEGPKPRLSAEQLAQFAAIGALETGPDREKDGVVRWRRVDLKRVIAERSGVDFHERYVGKLLKKLGFSHMSAGRATRLKTSGSSRLSKKLLTHTERPSPRPARDDADRDLVPGRGPHRPEERRSGNGQDAGRGLASPPTSATTTPICSAQFVRRAASSRRRVARR